MNLGLQFVIVVAFAALVGLAELVTRYRSNPGYVLRHSLAAWVYISLNGAAGAGALALIRAFGWFANSGHTDLWRILIAGFGALAFFRSSLFVTKIGNSDVNVGPSVVLGALLDACDRSVDRMSAEEISKAVTSDKMANLDPAKVNFALPVLCLALMQNFAPGDQAQLGAELSKIRSDTSITPETQMRAVVIQLSKYLGADLSTRCSRHRARSCNWTARSRPSHPPCKQRPSRRSSRKPGSSWAARGSIHRAHSALRDRCRD